MPTATLAIEPGTWRTLGTLASTTRPPSAPTLPFALPGIRAGL